jgi:hypothetical protein
MNKLTPNIHADMDTRTVCAVKCKCGNGYWEDRKLADGYGCPACDPQMGETPLDRIHNYRMMLCKPTWTIDLDQKKSSQ